VKGIIYPKTPKEANMSCLSGPIDFDKGFEANKCHYHLDVTYEHFTNSLLCEINLKVRLLG